MKIKRALVIIAVSVTSLFLCVFAVGVFSFLCEDIVTKWQIDNPYVNNRFSECQQILLPTQRSFCIPKDWSLLEENGVYRIYDQNNTLWAIGTSYGTENDRFVDYEELLATFVPLQSISIVTEPYAEVDFMKGANLNKLFAHGIAGTQTYYYICLMDTSGTYDMFVLFSDIEEDKLSFDIAEAIMYSYAWPPKGQGNGSVVS